MPEFIWFDNYKEMFALNSDFWQSLKVTIIFTVMSVLAMILWALLMAMLLNLKVRGIGLFQFLYFIPAVMPSVSLAFTFQLIFNKESGVANYLLFKLFGIVDGPNWLYDPKLVMPATIFVCLFTYSTGQMMLIFKSGMKDVPIELYEASDIDGAGFFRKFWNITLPSISPVILFNMVMAAISSLNNSFAVIYPLTGGGPDNATNVLSLSIYNNAFRNYRMGYASALAIMLFIIAALFSCIQFWMSKKWVHYET